MKYFYSFLKLRISFPLICQTSSPTTTIPTYYYLHLNAHACIHVHTRTHFLFAPVRHILLVHTRYLQSKQVTILFLTKNDDRLCNAVLTVCNSPVISYLCGYSARSIDTVSYTHLDVYKRQC